MTGTMSAKEAAEYCGIDYKLMRAWIRNEDPNDRPPGFFVGGRQQGESGRLGNYRIVSSKLDDWLVDLGRRQS